jgi:hypothetical protein
MTKRLRSSHAEVIGGRMVEPGAEFDESALDKDELQRLTDERKVADAVSAPAKTKTEDK